MITEQAKPKALAFTFRGVDHYYINVCSHCGCEDDSETTQHWQVDEDGDRVCHKCAGKETQ